jgi:hypothetical protein
MNHWIAFAAVCWLAGCASTGGAPARNDAAPLAATPAGCVSQTGSRIAQAATACTGPGRSYSQADIANTGQSTAAEALRLLDPTITVHH